MANRTTIPEVWLPLIEAFISEERLRLELGRRDIHGNKIPMSKMNFFRLSRGRQAPTVPQIEHIRDLCKKLGIENPFDTIKPQRAPEPTAPNDLFRLETIGRLLTAGGGIPKSYDLTHTLETAYDHYGEDALIEIAGDESKSLNARKAANYLLNDYER